MRQRRRKVRAEAPWMDILRMPQAAMFAFFVSMGEQSDYLQRKLCSGIGLLVHKYDRRHLVARSPSAV